jgi:hypothetical protein
MTSVKHIKVCIIEILNRRVISSVDKKTVRMSFCMRLRYGRNSAWYMNKFQTYCIHLNEHILSKVTNNAGKNKDFIAYSPVEYHNASMKEREFRTSYKLNAEAHIVEFTCKFYLTSQKETHQDLDRDTQELIEERRDRLLEYLEDRFPIEQIAHFVARYMVQELGVQGYHCTHRISNERYIHILL